MLIFAAKEAHCMLKVKTEPAWELEAVKAKDVRCPACGRKLSEVTYARGVVLLRVKCPKCKTFVNVDVSGVPGET